MRILRFPFYFSYIFFFLIYIKLDRTPYSADNNEIYKPTKRKKSTYAIHSCSSESVWIKNFDKRNLIDDNRGYSYSRVPVVLITTSLRQPRRTCNFAPVAFSRSTGENYSFFMTLRPWQFCFEYFVSVVKPSKNVTAFPEFVLKKFHYVAVNFLICG